MFSRWPLGSAQVQIADREHTIEANVHKGKWQGRGALDNCLYGDMCEGKRGAATVGDSASLSLILNPFQDQL